MGQFSNQMTQIADQLITYFGESVSFTRKTKAGFNPSTSQAIPGETTTYVTRGVPENYNMDEVDNSLIERGDMRLTLSKTTMVPLVGDIASFRGANWRVINVDIISAQGDNIVYQVQVRK